MHLYLLMTVFKIYNGHSKAGHYSTGQAARTARTARTAQTAWTAGTAC